MSERLASAGANSRSAPIRVVCNGTVRRSGFSIERDRPLLAGARWPRAAASRRRSPQEVDPSVGQLWRNATGRFGSSAVRHPCTPT